MKAVLTTRIFISAAALMLGACAAENPALTGQSKPPPPVQFAPAKPDPKVVEDFFTLSNSEFTATQARYDKNQVSVLFQVQDRQGKSVNGLKKKDLGVTENGVPVTSFALGAETENLDHVAEIMLLVDVTTSMGPFIEAAKLRLREFINTSRAKGYHTRMCISTFGDWVVKRCTRFFDNNPRDASTQAQIEELVSELTELHNFRGKEDPGWPDLDENPMRALIEAAAAPWSPDAQHFVILVTDAGFLIEPGNPSRHVDKPESKAPQMAEVVQAIKAAQMTVFAVTPSKPGYNSSFQGQPGVVEASGGEFFRFSDVIAGRITIDSILDRILRSIKTTYKLSYVVDEVAGLDPTLAVGKRSVRLSAPGSVEIKSVASSIPSGRPNYQKSWKVSDQPIQRGSMQVFVEDRLISAAEYDVTPDGQVRFKGVPPPGVSLRFVFLYEKIENNLNQKPINLPGEATAKNTKVYLNGREARAEDLRFERSLDGSTNLSVRPSALDANDIRSNKGLKIRAIVN